MHTSLLSLADAARFEMTSAENPLEIGAVLRFDERLPLDALRDCVRQRLLIEPRFTQTVVASGLGLLPRWRDERPFRIDAHVRSLRPGAVLSESAVPEVMSERLSQPLGFERSPWCFELCDLGSQGSAVCVRVHHCIADGGALVRLLARLADPSPAASALLHGKPKRPHRERAAHAHGFSTLRSLRHLMDLADDGACALHAQPSGRKRVAWSGPIELARLHGAAAAVGMHVTSLMLAATATALAEQLPGPLASLPDSARALVPVPVGPRQGEVGNHYASVLVELPLRKLTAAGRAQAIEGDLSTLRGRAETQLARRLVALNGALGRPFMRHALRWLSAKSALTFSNVVGPGARLSLAGRELRAIMVFAPLSGTLCLGVTAFGYAGELRLSVQTDAAVGIDPSRLVQAIEATLTRARWSGQPGGAVLENA